MIEYILAGVLALVLLAALLLALYGRSGDLPKPQERPPRRGRIWGIRL